jgi:hypothetical protein
MVAPCAHGEPFGLPLRASRSAELCFRESGPWRVPQRLDRYIGIDAVLIEEIDSIRPQPFQRGIRDRATLRRTAVAASHSVVLDVEAKLRGDGHLIRTGSSASPTRSSFV